MRHSKHFLSIAQAFVNFVIALQKTLNSVFLKLETLSDGLAKRGLNERWKDNFIGQIQIKCAEQLFYINVNKKHNTK